MNSIAKLRKTRGWSQAELAERAGTTQPSISRIENGSEDVTLKMLSDIAAALNVSVAELFDNKSDTEQALISVYRSLSPERRKGWDDMARAVLSETQTPSE